MKLGPFIFLGLLLALSLSWLGMIATPQLQLANEQPTNVPPSNVIYPTPHSGFANLGRDVYRANGCAYCHTQVVRQEGSRFEVVISKPGTNQADVVAVVRKLRPDLDATAAQQALASHEPLLTLDSKPTADDAQKALTTAGAEASVHLKPYGPDIDRGWGTRLSVAHDYLYETPLMLGAVRIGPDLTNVGLRRPDEVWQLVHLYDPKIEVPGSIMPRYPFLFQKRPRGSKPRPDALPIPGDQEVIPTREARALASYLVNLRTEIPLFEAPGPQMPGPAATNQPAGDTNQPPGGTLTNAIVVPNQTVQTGAGTNATPTNSAAPK
jgi:cbb3-type cytochrome oxidase cytochrome c subunit